jgi:hypothetical protein
MKLKDAILKHIESFPKGSVFVTKDFLDMGNYEAIRQALSRLAREGELRRVIRGAYDMPYYSELLEKSAMPRIDEVAKGLARNYSWSIAPAGGAAANLLGLSTQVPAKSTYISDGPSRKYRIGNRTLIFNGRSNRWVAKTGGGVAMAIEALRYLGKEHINEKTMSDLLKQIDPKEHKALLDESSRASIWIYKALKRAVDSSNEDKGYIS